MISYIQRKEIDFNKIKKLLSVSINKNHFTNNGPVKTLLEEYLQNILNLPLNKKVLCVANGTNALHALIYHYEIKSGKQLKWITPAFTFPSCVVQESNTEILDISPTTYTLDDSLLENKEFDGIILTNLFGSKLKFNSEKYLDKIIIYDNASSFMTPEICLDGNASFSSLHHTKTLGFGEGGFIVCDIEDYDSLKSIIGFGFKGTDRTYNPKSSNYKMSDVAAAYILQHIQTYNVEKHYEIQNKFISKIKNISGVKILNENDNTFYGNLPLIFDKTPNHKFFINANIEVNKYYKPLKSLKNSDDLYEKILNFPLYNTLTDYEIQYICDTISLHNDLTQ